MTRLLAVIVLAAMQNVAAQSTFHGNNARTGVYASPGPTKLNGIKWSFKTGGPIVSSAAMADGVVYIASYDGFLYAIDQETGKEKWKYKSRMPIASSPGRRNGLLCFFGGGTWVS
jgi:eukaryotic-like serine/threonine-protein kinase